jgi:hypothetical protein
MIFPGDMHWPYIDYSFVTGVAKALVGEGKAAENN